MTLGAALAAVTFAGVCVLAYAWFEAGWLRRRVIDVSIVGLPPSLDGLRIAHLSDFHFGAPFSRGNRAGERAAAWVAERRPDLVAITGDLVSHPRGEVRLRHVLRQLDDPFVVLGNHDVAVTRDPFSRAAELEDLRAARLLRDERVDVVLRDTRVSIAGLGPERPGSSAATEPLSLVDESAAFRVLLSHYPDVATRLPSGTFQLVLAGHLHAGQICIPLPGRAVTLAHPRARQVAGLYTFGATVLHVSPGTGTTFVPFRFFARPEVTELVLRSAA